MIGRLPGLLRRPQGHRKGKHTNTLYTITVTWLGASVTYVIMCCVVVCVVCVLDRHGHQGQQVLVAGGAGA